MDNQRLGALITKVGSKIEGKPGFWQFLYRARPLMVITDENHDRMRIMTPVTDQDQVNNAQAHELLAANFDRALDSRYATCYGILWSVFIHPLSELTETFFHDALEQVVNLAENYGTTYTSTGIVFGDDLGSLPD